MIALSKTAANLETLKTEVQCQIIDREWLSICMGVCDLGSKLVTPKGCSQKTFSRMLAHQTITTKLNAFS